jgi:hypothetical protein
MKLVISDGKLSIESVTLLDVLLQTTKHNSSEERLPRSLLTSDFSQQKNRELA